MLMQLQATQLNSPALEAKMPDLSSIDVTAFGELQQPDNLPHVLADGGVVRHQGHSGQQAVVEQVQGLAHHNIVLAYALTADPQTMNAELHGVNVLCKFC